MNKKTIILILVFTTASGKHENPCRKQLYAHVFSQKYFKYIKQENVDAIKKLWGRYSVGIPSKKNNMPIKRYLNILEEGLPYELSWVKKAKKSTPKQLRKCYGLVQNLKSFMKYQKIAGKNEFQRKYANFALEYLDRIKITLKPILMALYQKRWAKKEEEAKLMEAERKKIVKKYMSPLKQYIEQVNTAINNAEINEKIEALQKEKNRTEALIKKLEECI